MKTLPLPILLACLASASTVFGADLSRINRVIAKEPAYHSKPHYCLLVFGPKATTRVWLVQDGDTLYVDRNGNGDLTEPGKRIASEKPQEGADEGEFGFNIGDIRDGPRLHREITVHIAKIDFLAGLDDVVKAFLAKNKNARGYRVSAEVEMPGWKGAAPGGRVHQHASYTDDRGVLQFSDRPETAPMIHFGGPWQISLFSSHRFIIGRESDVVLAVGTPGVGPGTMASIDYENVIPENVYPTLDVTYPPKDAEGTAQIYRYTLKRRC
jgi:hypothetical protein